MSDAPRVIFHLDMDAFYASVEQRDNPSLRGKPVIVGSPPTQRGVVAAASYEARKFGVRSAMPSVTAGRLCPKGAFIRPRMDVYRQESRAIMAILAAAGGVIEPVSIDEAYLDFSQVVTGHRDTDSALMASMSLARELKRKIRDERELTATIGVAPNKLLAKMASDFQKPDGLTMIPELNKALFLRSFPIRAIPGVGKVTEQVLKDAGIATISDAQDFTGDLRALVGSFGPTLRRCALGEDDRPVEIGGSVKSISSEETFKHDTNDRPILRKCLREQADELAGKLKKNHLGAHTIQVKVRYSDFTTLTRQITCEEPVTEAGQIYRMACHLMARNRLARRPLRLLGLGLAGLGEPFVRQLELPLKPSR